MKSGSLVSAALLVLLLAGCGEAEYVCGHCPDEGCATMDEALDSWVWLIQCCRKMNLEDNKPKWAARWKYMPADWFLVCTGRVTCTEYSIGYTNCSDIDDPITWEDYAAMDECLMAQRTADNAWCDGDTLRMCSGAGTSGSVGCAVFCGDSSASCVTDGDGLATCSCGFPFVDAY